MLDTAKDMHSDHILTVICTYTKTSHAPSQVLRETWHKAHNVERFTGMSFFHIRTQTQFS